MAAAGASCLVPIPSALRPGKTKSTRCERQTRRGSTAFAGAVAQFALEPLPFALDALEPRISKRALEFHWDKHHRTYVNELNEQIRDTPMEKNSLEEIVTMSYNNGRPSPVFYNAGQAWNHEFYWSSIKPQGGGRPSGQLLALLERDFGTFERFLIEFKQAGVTQFGSGWVWLVLKKLDGKLAIQKTPNAINPLIWGHIPLLVVDVWEHAYYLDFQDRCSDYVSAFLDELVSWDAAEARLARAEAESVTPLPKL